MKLLARSVRLAAGVALILMSMLARPPAARAVLCAVPYPTFVAGTTAVAIQVNANFAALVSCGNSIDNTNIGSAGIFASQIVPLTVGEATFGGTEPYAFTAGLSVALVGSTAALSVVQGGASMVLAGNGFSPTASAAFGSSNSGGGLGWNRTGGAAETDFYNAYTSSNGAAFTWYYENTTSLPATQTELAQLNRNGVLGAGELNYGSDNAIGAGAGGFFTTAGASLAVPASSTQPLEWVNAADSTVNMALSDAGVLRIPELTASQCLETDGSSDLATTGVACAPNVTYSITVTVSGACNSGAACGLTGNILGNLSTHGCSASFRTANPSTVANLFLTTEHNAAGPNDTVSLLNFSAATISNGATFTVAGSCS